MQKLYREATAMRYNRPTTCNRVHNCGITDVCDIIVEPKRYRICIRRLRKTISALIDFNRQFNFIPFANCSESERTVELID